MSCSTPPITIIMESVRCYLIELKYHGYDLYVPLLFTCHRIPLPLASLCPLYHFVTYMYEVSWSSQ